MPVTGRSVVRRTLGRRLTALRAEKGKSRRDVVDKLGISEPTLHRIETGKVPVTPANVRALCWLYGADDATTEALAELARGTNQEEWWDSSPILPEWFKLYVGLEASASQLRIYDPETVPGELQTEKYALAMFRAEQTILDDDDATRHVGLRLKRQRELFERDPAPQLVFILGQGALMRAVGGDATHQDQIDQIRAIAQRPNVEVRVVPFSIGAHAGMAGGFRVLNFDDTDDPDIAYIEHHLGAHYFEDDREVAEFCRIFDLIRESARPIEEFLS